jgi:two-component system LytT family response regulator
MPSSKKLKVVIVEDEIHSRTFIKNVVGRYSQKLEVVGEAASIKTAVPLIDSLKPDILLLDIQLNDGLSFKILEKIVFKKYQTIFITSFDNYAIKAIKLSALDYVLKPIHIPELLSALDKAIENSVASNFEQNRPSKDFEKFDSIIIPSNGTYNNINFTDILAFVSENSYTRIILKLSSIISSKPLSYFEDIVPEYFLRCHRSSIVNCKQVANVEVGRGGVCELNNGYKVPVSVRRKSELMKALSGSN